MTHGLTDQVKALADYMDDQQGALLLEDLPITKRVRPMGESPVDDRSPKRMKTLKESKSPVAATRSSKRGPLVAAGVFATIIVVAAAFAVFRPGAPTPTTTPPADTGSTTVTSTTLVEVPPADPIDVALAFMSAQRNRDAEAAIALFAEDATIDTWGFDKPQDYASVFALWDAIGFTYVDEECTLGDTATDVVCRYTKQTDWLSPEQQAAATPLTGRLSFSIEDGLITLLKNHSPSIPGRDTVRAFVLSEATDQERDTMYMTSDQYMSLTPESIALWDRYTQAFIAARDG